MLCSHLSRLEHQWRTTRGLLQRICVLPTQRLKWVCTVPVNPLVGRCSNSLCTGHRADSCSSLWSWRHIHFQKTGCFSLLLLFQALAQVVSADHIFWAQNRNSQWHSEDFHQEHPGGNSLWSYAPSDARSVLPVACPWMLTLHIRATVLSSSHGIISRWCQPEVNHPYLVVPRLFVFSQWFPLHDLVMHQ